MQDLHKQLYSCFLPPQQRGLPWPGPVQWEMLTGSRQGPYAHTPGCGHARGVRDVVTRDAPLPATG